MSKIRRSFLSYLLNIYPSESLYTTCLKNYFINKMTIVSVPSLSIFCASIPCIRFPSNVHQSLSLRHLSYRCLLTPSCLKTYYTVFLYYLHLLYSYVAVGASNSKSILNCRALPFFFFFFT